MQMSIYIRFIVHLNQHGFEIRQSLAAPPGLIPLQSCGRIAPDCMCFQYIIDEHAHYNLINIPEA